MDFEGLLWPVTFEEFFARYWAKSTLFLPRGDRRYYGDLLTLADVDRCLLAAAADSASKSLQVVAPPESGRKNSEIMPAQGISKDRL